MGAGKWLPVQLVKKRVSSQDSCYALPVLRHSQPHAGEKHTITDHPLARKGPQTHRGDRREEGSSIPPGRVLYNDPK